MAAGPWREVFRSLEFKPNSLHSETSLTKGTGAQDEAGEGAGTWAQQEPSYCPVLT